MLSTEFEKFFEGNLTPFFDGVFAFDKIPRTMNVGHFVICNTDDSSNEGKHWFALYRSDKETFECFDSLGCDLAKQNLLQNTLNFCGMKKLKFNLSQVQSSTTETCGHFCIYFIYQRLYNKDLRFKELMNEIFDTDVFVNEEKVNEFVSSL